jgi:hypothetical protein
MSIYVGLLFSLFLLLPALLQRRNLQCGAMDGFRMRLFLVVVICIFFGCFRVVVYIPPVMRGRTMIPTAYRVSQSIRQTFFQQLLSKTTTRTMGVATWDVGGEEDEAKRGDNQSI